MTQELFRLTELIQCYHLVVSSWKGQFSFIVFGFKREKSKKKFLRRPNSKNALSIRRFGNFFLNVKMICDLCQYVKDFIRLWPQLPM